MSGDHEVAGLRRIGNSSSRDGGRLCTPIGSGFVGIKASVFKHLLFCGGIQEQAVILDWHSSVGG